MELVELVGLVCIGVTLFMFSAGISPCLKMIRTRSVKDVPFVLFLLSVSSCCGMVHYGYLIDDKILVFLNVVGSILNFIYMLVYIIVVKSKSGPLVAVFVSLMYQTALYCYCFNIVVEPTEYAHTIATSSSSITTVLILIGSIEVAMNFKNNNNDGMAFIMWIGSLSCSFSWLAYGLLINDATVYLPNIPGIIIGASKMFVFATYSNSLEKEKLTKKVD